MRLCPPMVYRAIQARGDHKTDERRVLYVIESMEKREGPVVYTRERVQTNNQHTTMEECSAI
jgi:hypothetical protein